MSYRNAGLLIVSCIFMSAAHAQGSEPIQLEAGSSLETLDKGYADWKSYYIEGAKKLGDRHTVYGSLRETERFKTKDTELLAGVYYPLSSRWTLLAEGNASPTHNILARWSGLAQIQYALDDGWGVHLGLRHTDYNNALSNNLLVTGERYWSNYRAAWTHSSSTLVGTGSASSDRIQLSRYYDEHSWIGLGISQGAEIESLGPTLGILSSRVQSTGLTGRHWFSSDWAISYEIAATQQGSLYTRNVFRLGLRSQF
ncbi:MAG: YaiO family outer membrane beta-barrel protein [Gallionella sp.]|nr:YaiO family outer membrane beta-barrel protein [Gallionella sp.]